MLQPTGATGVGRRLFGIGEHRDSFVQRTQLSADNNDGVQRAGNELEKIIHDRDLAMRERETYVEQKMHDMVTKPWATVHPLKLKRDELRDEALVRQAERQVKADQKLLSEAKSVSAHDKKLWSVAVARKSLQMDSDREEQQQRRDKAMGHLAAKHLQQHLLHVHPVPSRISARTPHPAPRGTLQMRACWPAQHTMVLTP